MPTSNLALPQTEEEVTLQNQNNDEQLDEYDDWYADWLVEQDYYSHTHINCDRYAD